MVTAPGAARWNAAGRTKSEFLDDCERLGWLVACREAHPGFRGLVLISGHGSDFLPVADGSLVLDATAGYGRMAAELASVHQVVALTSDPGQARFLAVRKRQDRLDTLTVMLGDPLGTRFADGQFQAVVAVPTAGSGELPALLEWAKALLVPGGYLYLGAGNRYGYRCLRASRRAAAGARPCGYFGYLSLFRRAGLDVVSTWISMCGAGDPSSLLALNWRAIQCYLGGQSPAAGLTGCLRQAIAAPWLWRLFGNDYGFLLRSKRA
jgi:SAM-dependent methyltransferase